MVPWHLQISHQVPFLLHLFSLPSILTHFFFALASFFVMEVFTLLAISMQLLQCFLWLLWKLLYVIVILCCCNVTCTWSFPSIFNSCSCSKTFIKILGLLLQYFSLLLWKPFFITTMCGFVTLAVVVPFFFFPSLVVIQRFIEIFMVVIVHGQQVTMGATLHHHYLCCCQVTYSHYFLSILFNQLLKVFSFDLFILIYILFVMVPPVELLLLIQIFHVVLRL